MRLRRPQTRMGWAAAGIAGAVLLGALFWVIAPYNIAASVPHMPGVRFLLHGYMHNAVRTWSLGAPPRRDVDFADPALVALGAGHFETGCAPCHGAPGRTRSPVALGMQPEPTDLAVAAPRLRDRELYWLVRNGLKYTGMPAWPAQHRPDEPWAVAAFLRQYPTLDAARYRDLVFGDAARAGAVAADTSSAVAFGGWDGRLGALVDTCARCHGRDGLGRGGVAPKLAGQPEAYLLATLDAYAEGRRASGFMQPLAAALPPQARADLARHYASLAPFAVAELGGATAPDGIDGAQAALIAEGAVLAHRGAPSKEIPSCVACHGPGAGQARRDDYPRLAGQGERWLRIWLRLWRDGERGGTAFAPLMHQAAHPLTDHQIEALAAYFAAGARADGAVFGADH